MFRFINLRGGWGKWEMVHSSFPALDQWGFFEESNTTVSFTTRFPSFSPLTLHEVGNGTTAIEKGLIGSVAQKASCI